MTIKEEYQGRIEEIIKENINNKISDIKSAINCKNVDIIENINNSKKYSSKEVMDLILYGEMWKQEEIQKINNKKQKLKEEMQRNKKLGNEYLEIESYKIKKMQSRIILIMLISVLSNIILVLYAIIKL